MKTYFVQKPKTGYVDIELDTKMEATFKRYKQSAQDRGYEFDISRNHFKHVITSKCYFCGSDPVAYSDGLVRNGVDRLDNERGYLHNNIIACCKICNAMKRDHKYGDFIAHIDKIYDQITKHTELKNIWQPESFQFKAHMFRFGRYLSPNELLECLNLKLLKKSDILYSFKVALRDFPKEYEIVRDQLRAALPKFQLKKFTKDYYLIQQFKEWNFYK